MKVPLFLSKAIPVDLARSVPLPSFRELLDINLPDCLKLEQILMQPVQIFGTSFAAAAQPLVNLAEIGGPCYRHRR